MILLYGHAHEEKIVMRAYCCPLCPHTGILLHVHIPYQTIRDPCALQMCPDQPIEICQRQFSYDMHAIGWLAHAMDTASVIPL